MMIFKKALLYTIILFLAGTRSAAQVVINEGTNMNYSSIPDENGDYPDWIELYNSGGTTVNLLNYGLTDDNSDPDKWVFPNASLAPGEYKVVFCSGKDRKPLSGFINVKTTGIFTPVNGWNTHVFTTPFFWDGASNILINTCSYSSAGYSTNSVFRQTATSFWSTSFAAIDGSPAACSSIYGNQSRQRPNMKLNNHVIGSGVVQNSPYTYPAPYGNWYWGARHQMLILASELTAAGLTAGNITSLAFNVVSSDPNTHYDYIDFHMRLVSYGDVPPEFEPVDPHNYLHTNFKISSSGETVYLYSPSGVLASQLFIECSDLDNSTGSYPDAASDVFLFPYATPSATNNASPHFTEYLLPPVFSVPSGFYEEPFSVSILNPNTDSTFISYTLDGSDPTVSSPIYSGNPISISDSGVLKARAFSTAFLPSRVTVATYLLNVTHTTPVISLVTDNTNLYGSTGIFDNWWYDWEKAAYVEYFDTARNLIFSQRTGIQIDGGWGGARANPQHSFRIELADPVLGDGSVNYPIIPDRPQRNNYSQFYLRNGSNQYLVYPYKDACEVKIMGSGTHNHYSAWRPVSVYINGNYFGLYELREKFDAEYFQTLEGSDPAMTDILTLSAWNNLVLHATEGSVNSFWVAYDAFCQLDPAETTFWDSADVYFDMSSYTDYIIGESWIGNTDWPWNNIKIYRSDSTGHRYRFCLTDLELAMGPNGWTDCYYDHIQYMLNFDTTNPYIHIWQKGIQNQRFKNYFINRFADVMNTAYLTENISATENEMFSLTLPEMHKEYARWGDPNNVLGQMLTFSYNHSAFQTQISERSAQVRNHILSNGALPNLVDVTLNVYPEGAGTITISTITPDQYPWQGIYFNGVPIQIEAIAAYGYDFSHWGSNGLVMDSLNAIFLDTLTTNSVTFDAYFSEWVVPVTETAKPGGFTLYPNPAGTVLFVRNSRNLNAELSYQIMDMNGRVVQKGTLQDGQVTSSIDIRSITSSVYLLQINSSEVNEHLRFVKIGY